MVKSRLLCDKSGPPHPRPTLQHMDRLLELKRARGHKVPPLLRATRRTEPGGRDLREAPPLPPPPLPRADGRHPDEVDLPGVDDLLDRNRPHPLGRRSPDRSNRKAAFGAEGPPTGVPILGVQRPEPPGVAPNPRRLDLVVAKLARGHGEAGRAGVEGNHHGAPIQPEVGHDQRKQVGQNPKLLTGRGPKTLTPSIRVPNEIVAMSENRQAEPGVQTDKHGMANQPLELTTRQEPAPGGPEKGPPEPVAAPRRGPDPAGAAINLGTKDHGDQLGPRLLMHRKTDVLESPLDPNSLGKDLDRVSPDNI